MKAALCEADLEMIGINTRPGDRTAGDFGLAALPGRQMEAIAAIDEALHYAVEIDAQCVHVMAGKAAGNQAHDAFLKNLAYAAERAQENGKTILIEPINQRDAPGYFLSSFGQAVSIIDTLGAPNLKLMFDCYHAQIIEGDVLSPLCESIPHVGHIQFASTPDRGPPDVGEIDYHSVFAEVAKFGWNDPLGAEYKPVNGDTDASLGWMKIFG